MRKGENIVKWIKGQRISWLGHLERMEEDRMPKKIFTQELEGTRRRGRHRKRWEEEVERDLHVLGVTRWRELVADRNNWKDIVRQAKAPPWAVVPTEEVSGQVGDDCEETVANWFVELQMPVLNGNCPQRKKFRFPGPSFIDSFKYVDTGLLSVSYLTTPLIGMFI